jgi:hypothetical protein
MERVDARAALLGGFSPSDHAVRDMDNAVIGEGCRGLETQEGSSNRASLGRAVSSIWGFEIDGDGHR